ncbi:dTDP-4-dehydrorhamnose reductase [Candidatus Scalindua japonica]|uniref:dTDP-4-dehydrorhamnose reductase n=1 Tax=Candidatus Scalindua japonica TaxID=1284222 RepID=A0A286TY05_9BACT|nr:sugar nucleotide-binding protein [Candidatus Scalindua japonica]GAX60757.1 dTDP-4-dehydrorhamnose reductase [Candidatus Scalindua japonica]
MVTGVTSIHGWPIFTQLRNLLPDNQLFGLKPPNSVVPDAKNVESFCITERVKLEEIRDEFKPTHIIHCAGVCDLDVCEERPEWAHSLNVLGTKAVVDVFGKNVPVVYMSTDLVFSGYNAPTNGYTEDDAPGPINVVGKTFVSAERYIQKCRDYCIIRLALPLGDSIVGKKGAIDWIENRFRRDLPVTLFYDEYRSCVECEEVGRVVISALTLELRGLFHLGGERRWSLFEIGKYVLDRGGYSPGLLHGRMRHEEDNGPPRIGDVSLNSEKLRSIIKARSSFF